MVGEGLQTQKLRSSSVENPELTNIFPLKRGAGQNIAVDASPTARNFFFHFYFLFFGHNFDLHWVQHFCLYEKFDHHCLVTTSGFSRRWVRIFVGI